MSTPQPDSLRRVAYALCGRYAGNVSTQDDRISIAVVNVSGVNASPILVVVAAAAAAAAAATAAAAVAAVAAASASAASAAVVAAAAAAASHLASQPRHASPG